ncbi:hypothetical protein [Mesorhizobium muleiense]|uniref:hypothetical protein n=1 Tax=Mesorhizobium muleiense TaxID=1004279 RepID=UPI001F2815A9|nr:hypothetical protein [Mesorhizobium muleiense]MCF6110014.1 hypothetical protein [Mesorhizobium muleiense]
MMTSLDPSDLPDPHGLDDDRLRVLWVMMAADKGATGIGAAEISAFLEKECRIALPRQRVSAILGKERASIVRVGRKAPAKFKIMKQGEDEVLGSGFQPLRIDPEKALTAIRKVEDIFGALKGNLKLCDTYVSNKTFDFLTPMKDADSIKLLTENVQDSGKFLRDLTAFQKEYSVPIEVRQANPGQLHDRYLIHDAGMLLMGGSLKDLTKKQAVIVALSKAFGSEIARAFDREWGRAKKLP